jgi:hypothetical protein
MTPKEIHGATSASERISEILSEIHTKGPINHQDLNELACFKLFHSAEIKKVEPQLMYLLGLFYKTEAPNDILSFVYNHYNSEIQEETGHTLTPVQASIRQKILENRYFSFSAPTSAGKSFLLREILKNETSDILIVVPSRALIAEYLTEVHDLFTDEPDVLILQFIDNINKAKTRKKVFVVTPERALEGVRSNSTNDIGLIIFDEAQISEEKIRGIGFDTFVRRSDTLFPSAKKVFAHPFVENPEAQLSKHNFTNTAASENYKQGSVGKIFVQLHGNGSQYLFSPYQSGGHLLTNCLKNETDRAEEAIKSGEGLLVFTSKSAIISGKYKDDFSQYLELCDAIDDTQAIEIIDEIEELIGAKGRTSDLVMQMRKGIVIHHGSIPLPVRSLIENFTRLGFAKVCFATSTLAQGVNMPFKVIWIHNLAFHGSDEDKALGLKNLIGRAGRTSQQINNSDFGFVIIKNAKSFIARFQEKSRISEDSVLDQSDENIPEDWVEFVKAIKEGTMNDELNLPQEKVDRLKRSTVSSAIATILEIIFQDDLIIKSLEYSSLADTERTKLKQAFHSIYENSLRRPLEPGEKGVLSAAITIFLMKIQGRSFKEILAIRYNYITKRSERRTLYRRLRNREINQTQYDSQVSAIEIGFSMAPSTLPNKNLTHSFNNFNGVKVTDLKYDALVYDTYDYLDKVISFSLTDIFVASFTLYFQKEGDIKAQTLANYMRYGTADDIEILLIRYGFTLDEIDEVSPHVESIDENEIIFKDSVFEVKQSRALKLVKRYQS